MTLTVVDHISVSGVDGGRNEDRVGWSADAAFVIDGATSLADAPRLADDGASDPEWLADMAAAHFAAALTADADARAEIRAVCANAAEAWTAAGGDAAAAWARPTAGVQILIDRGGAVETLGLGDCRLIAVDSCGAVEERSGLPKDLPRTAEQTAARAALAAAGGLSAEGSITQRLPGAMTAMRASRARHNTDAGRIWTLGVVPAAADRAMSHIWTPTRPAWALLATDGLSDLIDLYAAYDAPGLVAAARARGLAALVAEIRRFEREIDPDGARYPRFKRSDDSSAVLVELS